MNSGMSSTGCRGIALIAAMILAGCSRLPSPSREQAGAAKEIQASLVAVHQSSRATEQAVISGADKGTFGRLRASFAATLSRAETVAKKSPPPADGEDFAAHLRNYRVVLWGYEMYSAAWDFHDTYWNNCIRKGRQMDSCVDLYRKQGSELIAEAANVGVPIRPFVKDPMETVWTVAERLQKQADAQYLDAESQHDR